MKSQKGKAHAPKENHQSLSALLYARGKWEIGNAEADKQFCPFPISTTISVVMDDGKRLVVGEVLKTKDNIANVRDDERAMAHARLMANSPRMFEALIEFYHMVNGVARLTGNRKAQQLADSGRILLADIEPRVW